MNILFSKTKKSVNYIKNIPVGDEYLHEEFSFKNQRHIVLSLLLIVFAISVNVLFFSLKQQTPPSSAQVIAHTAKPVGVLSLRYLPLDPATATASAQLQMMDSQYATDIGDDWTKIINNTTANRWRTEIDKQRDQAVNWLGDASRYHGYKDASATPSVSYSIYDEKELNVRVPISSIGGFDAFKAFKDASGQYGVTDICDYVDNHNVKEVWIWTPPHISNAPESNMAPKTGGAFGSYGYEDISNSHPKLDDMPRCSKSYTLFGYDFTRAMTLHTHGHQIEDLLYYMDMDFAQAFYGTSGSTTSKNGCGSVHKPPNTTVAYDYYSSTRVSSDCQDWKPDRSGQVENIDCHTWAGADCGNNEDFEHLQHVWWMQNIPGFGNGLTFDGMTVPNFWDYIADFDSAVPSAKINITSSAGNGSLSGVVPFTANVTYAPGVQKVEFYKDQETTPFVTDTQAPFEATVDTTKLQNGGHGVSVKAYGNGNLLGKNATTTMYYQVNNPDTDIPTYSFEAPELGSVVTDSKVTIKIYPHDLGKIDRVNLYLSGETLGSPSISKTITTAPYNFDLKLTDGQYSFYAEILDLAGHNSSVAISTPLSFFSVLSDTDKDSFADKVESIIGTDPLHACGVNAWPADFNNDKYVNPGDQALMASKFVNYPNGKPPYEARFDLNGDGAFNIGDKALLSSKVGQKCTNTSEFTKPNWESLYPVSCNYYVAGTKNVFSNNFQKGSSDVIFIKKDGISHILTSKKNLVDFVGYDLPDYLTLGQYDLFFARSYQTHSKCDSKFTITDQPQNYPEISCVTSPTSIDIRGMFTLTLTNYDPSTRLRPFVYLTGNPLLYAGGRSTNIELQRNGDNFVGLDNSSGIWTGESPVYFYDIATDKTVQCSSTITILGPAGCSLAVNSVHAGNSLTLNLSRYYPSLANSELFLTNLSNNQRRSLGKILLSSTVQIYIPSDTAIGNYRLQYWDYAQLRDAWCTPGFTVN